MTWIKLRFASTPAQAEALGDALSEVGAQAVTLIDGKDEPVLEPAPGAMPLWNDTQVIGLFSADIDIPETISRLQAVWAQTLPDWQSEILEDKDWVHAWMDHFKPMHFGGDLWICPVKQQPPQPQAVNLLLDPGLAFGTGTHPTTDLCMRWLAAHPPKDLTILDYGCGSGVLAIAALLLDARAALGIDIDPQAITASRNNAETNGVATRLELALPGQTSPHAVDIILANILAGSLAELKDTLHAWSRPGTQLILSGILEDQAENVMDAYRDCYEFSTPVIKAGWVRLDAVCKGSETC